MNKKECLELLEELKRGVENLPDNFRILSADVDNSNRPAKTRIHISETSFRNSEAAFPLNYNEQLISHGGKDGFYNGRVEGNVFTFFISDSPAVISDD